MQHWSCEYHMIKNHCYSLFYDHLTCTAGRSINAHNYCFKGPISKILCFSESLRWALSNDAIKSWGQNLAIFDKKPWTIYKWMILSKSGHFENIELNIPPNRVFCGLSEYLKIICIGWIEHKLWTFYILILNPISIALEDPWLNYMYYTHHMTFVK